MDFLGLQTLIGILFGTGGVGLLTVAVTSYRRLKTGKLGDDGTLIARLHQEHERSVDRADKAESKLDRMVSLKDHWREQAMVYRVQLLTSGVTPDDREAPSE